VLADYEALAGDAPAPTLIPPANAGPLPRDWAGLQKAGLLVLALGLVVASYWWWMGRVAPPEPSVAAVAPNVASTVLPADSAAGDADGAAIVPPLGDAMMLGDAADGSPAPVAGRNELPAAVASAATRAATPPAAKPPATATTPAAPAAVTVAAGATPLAAKPANTTASPPIAAPVAGATKAPAPLPAPSSVATAPQAARVPLTSGQAPPPLIAPVVDGPQIVLRGKKDCWVEVRAAGGARLFYGLVRPGETHTMPGPAPWFVYLGFADGIEVSVGGHVVDVPAARREGVKARFGVSADGTPR
jgi:cytoskeletal protein RodZ